MVQWIRQSATRKLQAERSGAVRQVADTLRAAAIYVVLVLMTQAACSSTASPSARPVASPVQAVQPSPSPFPTAPPSPSPSDSPEQPSPSSGQVQPSTVAVTLSRLPAGIYPVHLHSRCSGSQSFHITVLQSLRVSSGGSGSIYVSGSYFGRGLCLVVYSSPSLSALLATRSI